MKKLRLLFVAEDDLAFAVTDQAPEGLGFFFVPAAATILDSGHEVSGRHQISNRVIYNDPRAIGDTTFVVIGSAWIKGTIRVADRDIPYEIEGEKYQGFRKVVFDGRRLYRSWFH